MPDRIVFHSMDEYFNVLREIKRRYKPIFTNLFIDNNEIDKLIKEGRLSYEDVEGGILIYRDEMKYYRVYLYLNADSDFSVTAKDKPLMVNLIYYSDREKGRIQEKIENQLSPSGFILKDHMGLIMADVEEYIKKNEGVYEKAIEIMQGAGFKLKEATFEMLDDIKRLPEEAEELPFYQIPYESDEEMIESGKIFCIVDENDKVCAMRRVLASKADTHGWIVVDKQYKKNFGFAVVLSMRVAQYAREHDLRLCGWIAEWNTDSIKLNTKMGYCAGNKSSDYWVMDKQ